MTYTIGIERGDLNYLEIEPLYREHYAQMQARLSADGMPVSDYKPNLTRYFEAFAGGWLLNFVARLDGEPVGYCNVYLTNDMHNGDLIAQEDTLFVLPQHRNGLGRNIVQAALAELRERGVKRVSVSAVTDLRVAKVWKRMGFREAAVEMRYTFPGGNKDV